MRGLSSISIAIALLAAVPSNAYPRCADLALVLAIDVSSSIDEQEFQLQTMGYAAAFTSPAVLNALNAAGTVDVASVFWADSAVPPLVTRWFRIVSRDDAAALADSFLTVQRSAFGETDLGVGLMTALDLLEAPGQCSARAVINVSGDGRASVGNRRSVRGSLAQARARAEAMGVTINGLAIVNAEPELAKYYRTKVIVGPGAFVMEAQDFWAFGDAIVMKLEREIQPQFSVSVVTETTELLMRR
ncbi:DUF1194 domain-containing protein [Tabrizicola sp. WMC-M-20]|nr:DUF1194 domain-containing protein [Tabrizicola sp. WMC-M-20]